MMRNISVQAFDFPNSTDSLGCSYSFVVKYGFYNFSVDHLDIFPYKMLPLVLDWSVGSENCKASKGKDGYACKKNSDCDDEEIGFGYRCKCKEGYEGDPYHPEGCIGNLILPLNFLFLLFTSIIKVLIYSSIHNKVYFSSH